MARVTGLSLATYRRLERGLANPPVRDLTMCALALGYRTAFVPPRIIRTRNNPLTHASPAHHPATTSEG